MESLGERVELDTNWRPDLIIFEAMEEKMGDLEKAVASMEEPSWIRRRLRGAGEVLTKREKEFATKRLML